MSKMVFPGSPFRGAVAAFVLLVLAAGCVHVPPKHNVDGVDKTRQAILVGSRTSDGAYTFEYFLVDQIDHKDIRTRFDFTMSSLDEVEIPVEQGRRVIWVEGRVRRGIGSEPMRFAGTLVAELVAGRRYQVRGRSVSDSGEISLVDIDTGSTLASIANVAATKPPPGYPVSAIPIFIRR